jgi:hypothetical protein
MIRRNVTNQTIYLPKLSLSADNAAVTSGASAVVSKDGTEAEAVGTLTHYSGGVWKYTFAQAETDAAIVAIILTASGAEPVVLNLVTTAANTAAVAFGANTTAPDNSGILTAVNTRLAASSYTAPDNAGIGAIKVVTDRINTGLVADGGVWQLTANMLELTPSSSGGLTPVQDETLTSIAIALAGSAPVEPTDITVFGLLEGISSQTSQITGSRINTVGPVSAAGDITLIVGKDYKVASESELTISVPDTAGALHADFTSETLAASKAFGMSRSNGDADISGTVSSVTYATNVTTFKVEIDADRLPDTLSLTDDWTYQIERVTSAGDKVVGVQGAGKVAMRSV